MSYSLSVTDVVLDDLQDAVAEVVSKNDYDSEIEAQVQKSVDIAESMGAYLDAEKIHLTLSGHVGDRPSMNISVSGAS